MYRFENNHSGAEREGEIMKLGTIVGKGAVLASTTALVVAAAGTGVSVDGHGAPTSVSMKDKTLPIGLQMFASEVETLGAQTFPSLFAGARLMPTGVVYIYVHGGPVAPFTHAIQLMNNNDYATHIVLVPRTYAELNAMSVRLIANSITLSHSGVQLTQSWPNPANGILEVEVSRPTANDISELRSNNVGGFALGSPVAATTWLQDATALVSYLLGSTSSVQLHWGVPSSAMGRINDTSPFDGGDQIHDTAGTVCTGGFAMTGNASGNTFMLAAGHCGSGTWYTQAAKMGSTSTSYFENGSQNDFQTIYVPAGALPYVWGNSGLTYPVTGQLLPAPGTQVTFDGSVTGMVTNNTVLEVDGTDFEIYDSVNGTYYSAFPVIQASNPNGNTICQPGDSGGPVFQRTSGSNVNAVGTIVAYDINNGECSAEQIGAEEAASNTSLLTP